MAAGKTLSPARAPTKRHARGVLRLRCPAGLGSPSSPGGHAEGWERVAAGGGRREEAAAAIPCRGSPRRGGEDGLRRCQGGRGGAGELSGGSRSPRQGGAVEDGRRRVVGYAGSVGYAGEWSGYPGGIVLALPAAESGSGSGSVHTCQVCFKSFGRAKALYGHMRSCRGAAAATVQPPAVPRPEMERQVRDLKKEGEYDLLAETLARNWAVTRQRGRGRIRSHGASSQQARSARVVIGRMQIGEENLEKPWFVEMVRGAEDLMFFNAGEADFSPVAGGHRNPAKIPEVKVPEPSYTACNSSVVPPGATVIVIDDDDDEPNKSVGEINASSVTIAISAPDAVATAPAPATPAAAVTIAPAPYAAAAMTTATAPVATAAAVTIAVAAPPPHGNGGVAAPATAGAGEMKVFSCTKCSRAFHCFRGLGGHMAAHINREKKAKEKELQDISNVSASLVLTLSGSAGGNGRRMHVCPKCAKEFETGQSLGGHMRLHYGGRAGRAAPAHSSGFRSLSPATGGSSFACVHEPESVMATGSGISLPAAATSSFPDQPPGMMATSRANGARGRFRLFGVDIAEGPKEEPKE